MASRMRTTATNIFDAFYIFLFSGTDGENSEIRVIKRFPADVDDKASLAAIKKFCFPKAERHWAKLDAVSHFTFTLTDGQGLFTFGHCRFSPTKKTCYCMISALPDLAFFKSALEWCTAAVENNQLDNGLTLLYTTPMPEGEQQIKLAEVGFASSIRDFNKYFSSFNEMEVLLLYNSLQFSPTHLINLYSSILRERRIVITSSRLETLTNCSFGALKLMYPFHWQSIFVPILPAGLTDQLMAPMPYIIGVPKETLDELGDLAQFGEITLLDVDNEIFRSDTDDSLPSPIYKYLLKQLKTKNENSSVIGPEALIRNFMKANIMIFGRYRTGLCKADADQRTKITWDKQRFIDAQPAEIKGLVQLLVGEEGVQYFERFVDERLECLNNGIPTNEEFDHLVRNVDMYYQEALDASRNLKDSLQGVVSGVKNTTNAAISSLKDTVQQSLKRKPKSKSKKSKELPIMPYSFAPPTLPTPETPLPPEDLHANSPSPEHLMEIRKEEILLRAMNSPALYQPGSSSNSGHHSMESISGGSTNPFLNIQEPPVLSSNNPFLDYTRDSWALPVIEQNNGKVPPSRDHWEKFE